MAMTNSNASNSLMVRVVLEIQGSDHLDSSFNLLIELCFKIIFHVCRAFKIKVSIEKIGLKLSLKL